MIDFERIDLRVTIELLRDSLLPAEAYAPKAVGKAIATAVTGRKP